MKKDIHPTYYKNATISCACGNTLTVGSTSEQTSVELCAKCHPFYTGKQKLIDTARRVEKFEARKAASAKGGVRTKTEKRAKRAATKTKKDVKTVEQA